MQYRRPDGVRAASPGGPCSSMPRKGYEKNFAFFFAGGPDLAITGLDLTVC